MPAACVEWPHDVSTLAQDPDRLTDAVAAYRAGEALGRGDIETATGDCHPPRTAAVFLGIVVAWHGGRLYRARNAT